jgi:hypothetical protein
LNVNWLQDKRIQLVTKSLLGILGAIVLFATLFNLFGYAVTVLIAVVGFLALWIVTGQVVS